MQRNFDISYATGTIILITLGSLTAWHFARLIPVFFEALRIVLLLLLAVTAALVLFTQKREAIAPWFFLWFLVGLGAIFAWN